MKEEEIIEKVADNAPNENYIVYCDYCLRPLQECNFIVSACCGHSVEQGYIQLADGRLFREVIIDE